MRNDYEEANGNEKSSQKKKENLEPVKNTENLKIRRDVI